MDGLAVRFGVWVNVNVLIYGCIKYSSKMENGLRSLSLQDQYQRHLTCALLLSGLRNCSLTGRVYRDR
jgi:hypothetical protein